MSFLRRIPAYVWGMVATVIVVTLLISFAPDKDEKAPAGPEKDQPARTHVDPDSLKKQKDHLQAAIRTFVQARFSRQGGLDEAAYIARLEPLVNDAQLADFKAELATPGEKHIIAAGVSVMPKIVGGEPYGHPEEHGGVLEFTGQMRVALVMTNTSGRSVRVGALDYELVMEQNSDGKWIVTYCSPVFT